MIVFDVNTWKIEEGVENVETFGVVSLDKPVGVIFLNVFPAEHKRRRDQTHKCSNATEKLMTKGHKSTFQG